MEKTYRIGEVAEILRLKTYVLRFWETEFPQLEPLRTESGQRLYTQQQLETARRIQTLLHEQGMTIEGARRVMQGGEPCDEAGLDLPGVDSAFLAMLETELTEICEMLQQGQRE